MDVFFSVVCFCPVCLEYKYNNEEQLQAQVISISISRKQSPLHKECQLALKRLSVRQKVNCGRTIPRAAASSSAPWGPGSRGRGKGWSSPDKSLTLFKVFSIPEDPLLDRRVPPNRAHRPSSAAAPRSRHWWHVLISAYFVFVDEVVCLILTLSVQHTLCIGIGWSSHCSLAQTSQGGSSSSTWGWNWYDKIVNKKEKVLTLFLVGRTRRLCPRPSRQGSASRLLLPFTKKHQTPLETIIE